MKERSADFPNCEQLCQLCRSDFLKLVHCGLMPRRSDLHQLGLVQFRKTLGKYFVSKLKGGGSPGEVNHASRIENGQFLRPGSLEARTPENSPQDLEDKESQEQAGAQTKPGRQSIRQQEKYQEQDK